MNKCLTKYQFKRVQRLQQRFNEYPLFISDFTKKIKIAWIKVLPKMKIVLTQLNVKIIRRKLV